MQAAECGATSLDRLPPLVEKVEVSAQQKFLQQKVLQQSKNMGAAIIHLNDMPVADNSGAMLLNSRQKQWLEALCYDVYTENPVQYKLSQDASKLSKEAKAKAEEEAAVLKLPNEFNLHPPSGLIQDTARLKRFEHLELSTEYEEAMSVSSNRLENSVKEVLEHFSMKLSNNAKEIEKIISEIHTPEKLQKIKMRDLLEVWDRILKVISYRDIIVKDVEEELSTIELERLIATQEILKTYNEKLKKVAYLMPDQLIHIMELEGISVNLAVVANKKQYAKIYCQVNKVSLALEKDHRKSWEDIVEEWKEILIKRIQDDFSQFMNSKVVQNTDEEIILRDELLLSLQIVEGKRTDMMERIGQVSPPAVSNSLVCSLQGEVANLYNEFNAVHSKHLFKVHSYLESIQLMCETKMDSIKVLLINMGACDSQSSYKLIMAEFLPQVEQHMFRLKEKRSAKEKALDSVFIAQKEKFADLFEFIQELSTLWTTHESDLDNCRKELTERLDEIRSNHDTVNQNLEANLDLVLDRLRQSATKDALERYMKEAMTMLETIKTGYDSFKTTMIANVETYPNHIQKHLDSYEVSLLQLLGVKHVIASSISAQKRLWSSGSHKVSTIKAVIRTSQGHIYKVIDEVKSASEVADKVKEGSSESEKKKNRSGVSTRKEKVRFYTKKESPSKMQGEKKSGKEKGLTVGGADLKHEGKGGKKRKGSSDSRKGCVVSDSRKGSVSDSRKGSVSDSRKGSVSDSRKSSVGDSRRGSVSDGRRASVSDGRRGSVSDRRGSSSDRSPRGRRVAKKTLTGGTSSDKKEAKGQTKPLETSKEGQDYLSKDREEEDPMKGTFMTQNEEFEEELSIAAVSMKESAYLKLLYSIRLNFLEHLDSWKTTQVDNATKIVVEKREEMLTELDLRLHLHGPRPMRITKDIHDVRAAELVVHGERVNRHADAIAEALAELKEAPATITAKLEEKFLSFTTELASITFSGVSSLKLLEKVYENSKQLFKTHLKDLHNTFEEYKHFILAKFEVLSQSNTKYKTSVRLFKDGGNYCPEEVEVFSRKLEKIGDKIENSEQLIEGYLSQAVEEYVQRSHEALEGFDEICEVYQEEFAFMKHWKKSIVSLHVLLKGEVARSVTQAKRITLEAQALKEAVDNTRSKDMTQGDLTSKVSEVFDLVADRAHFLQASQNLEEFREAPEDSETAKKPISTINIIQNITGHQGSTASKGLASAEKKKRATLKPPIQSAVPSEQSQDQSCKDSASHKLASHCTSILSKHKSRKKFMLDKYGNEQGKDVSNLFLPNIKGIIKTKIAELGKEAENFYLLRTLNATGQPKISHRQIKSSHVPCSIDIFLEMVEAEVEKHHTQTEEQRWKFIKEFKCQCKEVIDTVLEVPDVILAKLSEQHSLAATTCWQDYRSSLKVHVEHIKQKRVLLERQLNPSLGRPDRTNGMKRINEQEDQVHTEALNTLDRFGTEASKAQQSILSKYIQDLFETTKYLLSLADQVTLPKEIKDDPSLPKPRPNMEDLIKQNVTVNIGEAARVSVSIDSSAEQQNQDVVLTKGPDGDLTIQAPKSLKLSAGAQRVSGETHMSAFKRRKLNGQKSQHKLVEGNVPLCTFKNSLYFWKQLPCDTTATLLSSISRPLSKQSTTSTFSSADKKQVSSTPAESSWSTVLEKIKEPLKTKKATALHEIIVTTRDKEFEKFVSLHKEFLAKLDSAVEGNLQNTYQSHQQWIISVDQIQRLYTVS